MIRLRYGFLCDYAAPGAQGKPNAIGVFDSVWAFAATGTQMYTPPCFMHAALDGSFIDANDHTIRLTLVSPDGDTIRTWEFPLFIDAIRGAGNGKSGYFYCQLAPMPIACYGEYEWVIAVDNAPVGRLSLYVVEPVTIPS